MGERKKLIKVINLKENYQSDWCYEKNIIKQSSIQAEVTTLATLTLNLNDKKEPAKGTQHSEPGTSWCKGPEVE